MSDVGDRDAVVRALIEQESWSEGDKPAVVGDMQRLCRAATRALPALGVGVTLISSAGPQVTVAASGEEVELIEELQFSLGEGPCFEAHGTRRPVLIPDLFAVAPTRWPAMVKSTTVTLPSGPDGVSAGIAVTWSMRLSGMIET